MKNTSDGAGKIISDYMRSLALKSREAVAKKYGVEGGKNKLYSEMGKRRWKNHAIKRRKEAIAELERLIKEQESAQGV